MKEISDLPNIFQHNNLLLFETYILLTKVRILVKQLRDLLNADCNIISQWKLSAVYVFRSKMAWIFSLVLNQ